MCNFQGNFKSEGKFRNVTMKAFQNIFGVIYENFWRNSRKTVKKLLGTLKICWKNFKKF